MADGIGDHAAAANYRTLWGQIRDAFDAKYVKSDGTVGGGSQTAYVLALSDNLLPDAQVTPAANKLVANIAAHGGHLTTGFLGTGELLPTLTRTGHNDVAYQILQQKTFPSWGYEIDKGATTIWERWDGIKTDGTFNDPGMNSFNHYGLGSVGDWMYQNIAGIAPAAPGYQRVVVHPRPGGTLTWASARYRSDYGDFSSKWSVSRGRFNLDVSVPVGTTAEVWVPAGSTAKVSADGATFSRTQDGNAVYTVGSGNWHFHTCVPRGGGLVRARRHADRLEYGWPSTTGSAWASSRVGWARTGRSSPTCCRSFGARPSACRNGCADSARRSSTSASSPTPRRAPWPRRSCARRAATSSWGSSRRT
jgi:alpha-L-rhamnosidase